MAEWGIAMSNFHPMRPGAPSEAEMERDAGAFVALAQLATAPHAPRLRGATRGKRASRGLARACANHPGIHQYAIQV
jgi:hypothetical protein